MNYPALLFFAIFLFCLSRALALRPEVAKPGAPKNVDPDHPEKMAKGLVEGKNQAQSWKETLIPEEARKWWAFQPLQRPEPPPVKNEAWCRTPIDRFILKALEEKGLAPNPPVTKRQLIRRVHFGLLGLPPSPEEVDAFLNDSSADGYDQLLDRLLLSPHYGECWGRHWLDLARFAESHGFEHDYDRPSAYHYRDFVIEALNQDLPFDVFVKWQIAGDELEPENNLALKATGFLAAGVHSTQITKNEVERHRYDELDDVVSTIGTSMLGLTLGCARCHDHKYDPIPQGDYYRLISTFTTTVRSEIDLNLDPEGYRKAKAAFDQEHAPFAAAVKKFEEEHIPACLEAWERSRPAAGEIAAWIIPELSSAKSEGGATLTRQDDGSVFASGENPKHDTYTIVAETLLAGITAIRLEALAHPSMVKGGPGRASNGNFALTDFRLTAAPKNGASPPVPVKLRNPKATFEQKGLPVAAAIDGDKGSGWAIDPEFGKDHAAIFETEVPVGFEGGTVLAFTLEFKNIDGHSFGRTRLAVTARPPPASLEGDSTPEAVASILKLPGERRAAEQAAALRRWYRTIDPEWRRLHEEEERHLEKAPKPNLVKALISSEGLQAVRLHTQGEDFLRETCYLKRGDPEQKDGIAKQSFLQALMPAFGAESRWQVGPPQGWRTSYRRASFSSWLTDVERGAGGLLARVIANRLWQFHMGRGIVATPSDFGARGEKPSHPELLDWLASELIRNRWRLKPIHKLILTSAVYLQGSGIDEAKARADADNRLFWRRPRRRLEAEVIRDAILKVSGSLDQRLFGPGTLEESSSRRSIYFTVKRSKFIPMMQVFDAPDALQGVADRPTTTIAPQALLLMNNPNIRGYARCFARKVAPEGSVLFEEAVRSAYRRALGRAPSEVELEESVEFLKAQEESYRQENKAGGRELALADFCQALFCMNEFVYVE